MLKATPGNVQAIYLQAVMDAQAKDYKDGRRRPGAALPAIIAAHPARLSSAGGGQGATRPDRAGRGCGTALPGARAERSRRIQGAGAASNSPSAARTRWSIRWTRSPNPARPMPRPTICSGRAYAATGRADEAVKAFQKAQTLAPNDVGVQTRLATVRMGMGEPTPRWATSSTRWSWRPSCRRSARRCSSPHWQPATWTRPPMRWTRSRPPRATRQSSAIWRPAATRQARCP